MPRVTPTTAPPGPGYPDPLVRDVALRDGTRIHLRPVRPDDQERLIAFHDRLSEETVYQRFFNVVKHLPATWAQFLVNVDYDRRLALVAEHGDGPARTLVAVARYDATAQADTAEMAFVVQDDWQNRGLGTILLDALLEAAEARGIRRFRASVLASNSRMLDLLARGTDVCERHTQAGVTELVLTRRSR
ncbi:MAG TPA: GNAT family N-acetyltransferase [Methylomirabilota bacterium]|nr:GNAT family N-acetyltransferase [Methylomirabilota bacterium]